MIDRKKLKSILPERVVSKLRTADETVRRHSIVAAVREQGLTSLYELLCRLVPDITCQYSTFSLDSDYQKTKTRAQHSFQISLIQKAFSCLNVKPDSGITIVDIGDSSGVHLQYLQGLYDNIRALSVNLDNEAVLKIKNKGMEAVHARAEDLHEYSIFADLFLSFEMLEHLSDPIQFLHMMSKTNCRALIVTVPYLGQSRIGLHHIRHKQFRDVSAETTHVFELSPEDWRLIFFHSGWEVRYDNIYRQYPRSGIWSLTKQHWKKTDFEGFYGAVLVKNNNWSKLYKDWNS